MAADLLRGGPATDDPSEALGGLCAFRMGMPSLQEGWQVKILITLETEGGIPKGK